MTDIDIMLRRLRDMPAPEALAHIDDAVLHGLSVQASQQAAPGAGALLMAAIIALGIGVAGSALPVSQPSSSSAVLPLGVSASLIPLTLLDTAQ